MNPGKLRDRITFYYLIKNADGYGGYTTTSGGSMEIFGVMLNIYQVNILMLMVNL